MTSNSLVHTFQIGNSLFYMYPGKAMEWFGEIIGAAAKSLTKNYF